MDHVARAEVLIGAPAERVWDVLTSPEPRPEIMFGARIMSDWQPGHRITWSGRWEARDARRVEDGVRGARDLGRVSYIRDQVMQAARTTAAR